MAFGFSISAQWRTLDTWWHQLLCGVGGIPEQSTHEIWTTTRPNQAGQFGKTLLNGLSSIQLCWTSRLKWSRKLEWRRKQKVVLQTQLNPGGVPEPPGLRPVSPAQRRAGLQLQQTLRFLFSLVGNWLFTVADRPESPLSGISALNQPTAGLR